MIKHKAQSLNLRDLKTVPMRTFHITWFSFFMCFFAWFGVAPLMPIIRDEFALSREQIGTIIVASVAATIFMRLFLGYICDRIGPRLTYTWLLALGSIPVIGISFSNSYESFLFFRLLIGCIGASFVITQYHTSVMFAPNVVGTANATSAGWGNLGGGVTQMVMPLLFSGIVALGASQALSWRLSMAVTGIALIGCALLYFFFTQDFPDGNIKDIKEQGHHEVDTLDKHSGVWDALANYRIWVLFLVYGACFGIELTINNVAALYYTDRFHLDLKTAGLIAGLFGLMNIFARSLGGVWADRFGNKNGLRGRVRFLCIMIAFEGLALLLFSKMNILILAIASMILFSLFVQMAEGATYSVVPFVNRKHLGLVSGIVGAGGNVGAVIFGFFFRNSELMMQEIFSMLGLVVLGISVLVPFIRFSTEKEQHEKSLLSQTKMARSNT